MNDYPKHLRAGAPYAFPLPGAVTRREVLRWKLAAAAWLAAGGLGLGSALAPSRAGAQGPPHAVVAKGAPGEAVRAAVAALGGIERFVPPGAKVVIKPNMSFPHGPEAATNTHPEAVAALAQLCRDAGAARVLVLDNTLADAEQCMRNSGIRAACDAVWPDSVHVLSSSRFFSRADIREGKALRHTEVMTDVLEADVLIAAAKAKSHSGAGVSMCLKGMMGLIRNRGELHRAGLHESIVDLGTLLRPALAVVDATSALSTGGPFGPGTVVEPGVVVASHDPVSADALGVLSARWYGQDVVPAQVRHIRLAHERGLGRMDVENLNVARVTA